MNSGNQSSPDMERDSQSPAVVRMINLSDVSDSQAALGPPVIESINPLHQVKAYLQVCVGEAVMTVGELLGAKEHHILRLNKTVDQPVDLVLEGKVVARGQLVAVDDCFAVRITELPLPLKV